MRNAVQESDHETRHAIREWLVQEFGREGIEVCDAISHPKHDELIEIPEDLQTADESTECPIIPAGKYRVIEARGYTSSHSMHLENMEDGTTSGFTVGYHGGTMVDWRGCKRIHVGPLFRDVKTKT